MRLPIAVALQLLALSALAAPPDPLAQRPEDGCAIIDDDPGAREHELQVTWRLQPGAEARDLQRVEIGVTTPIGGLHLAPLGPVSLSGKEGLAVPRGSDGCARVAMVQSKLSGRDKDGARLLLRAGGAVDSVNVSVRFQDGDAAPHPIDLTQPARSVVNTSALEVTVLVTPLQVEVTLDGD